MKPECLSLPIIGIGPFVGLTILFALVALAFAILRDVRRGTLRPDLTHVLRIGHDLHHLYGRRLAGDRGAVGALRLSAVAV